MTMTFLASIIFVATSCVTSNKLENIFNDEYVVTRVDGLIESNDVSSIISNTVTKQYVEGLGISGGGGDVASVNGKTGTVVIAASDVHARPDDWMPTAAEVGARPNDWMPNAQDVGARPDDWMPTASEVGAVAVGANGGVAIGAYTTASGYYSHAEGRGTTASGYYSHAEGAYTTASGYYSHAEGSGTTASGNASHAEGAYANANENYSFSWNGDSSITYDSHGIGTFNLNPLGGLSGLWIGGLNLETILGGYAKRTGETETVDFRNTRTMVKTQLAPVGEDAVNFDMLVRYADAAASSIATTYAPTNALVSLNQSVQYVTADSNGSAVEILAPTNSMKDWVVYLYTTTNTAVLFPTGTVYAVDSTVTNALKPNVVTALYLSSYPAVTNGLIVGRQEMNPIVIVR